MSKRHYVSLPRGTNRLKCPWEPRETKEVLIGSRAKPETQLTLPRFPEVPSVVSPTVKSREFYFCDDIIQGAPSWYIRWLRRCPCGSHWSAVLVPMLAENVILPLFRLMFEQRLYNYPFKFRCFAMVLMTAAATTWTKKCRVSQTQGRKNFIFVVLNN